MIWKVLKKIITAPLHIVEHSYKRAQQGFAYLTYLTRRTGYVQYGPDAKPADGRAYVSSVFGLEARPDQAQAETLAEAGADEVPHLDPNDLGFDYTTALQKYTTQCNYFTRDQKPVPYPDFAATVLNNMEDDIKENIKDNKNVRVTLKAHGKLSDGEDRWFSTVQIPKDLNKYTSDEELEQLLITGIEDNNNNIVKWSRQYQNVEMLGVDRIAIGINRNPSRRGGTFIQTLDTIKAKHGLINVDNSFRPNLKQEADNLCFKYAVCVGRFHGTLSKKLRRCQLSRPHVWKPYFKDLDWTGVSFPTPISDIDTFEKNNSDVIVNIWTLEEDNLHCQVARRSARKVVAGLTHSIDLLMFMCSWR
jgi:hypothetical protein